jgi:hypothetical protein
MPQMGIVVLIKLSPLPSGSPGWISSIFNFLIEQTTEDTRTTWVGRNVNSRDAPNPRFQL